MRPLHVRRKEEYVAAIEATLEGRESAIALPLESLLEQAFEDHSEDESLTAWVASLAYATEHPRAADLQRRFLEAHSASLHPVRVDHAEAEARAGRVDNASNEARAFLRHINEYSLLPRLGDVGEALREACGRAFLLLTSVYTEAAARSYSLRVLDFALSLPLAEEEREALEAERESLRAELRDPRHSAPDEKWELFFRGGGHASQLVHHCQKMGFPILARRVDVLWQQFREQPDYKIDEAEIFQLVYATNRGAFVLM